VPAGTLSCFNRDTIIQPDNPVPIMHPTLSTQQASGEFEIIGSMYEGFVNDLAKAVRASVTLSPQQQRRTLGMIGL
jgi:hypothetical protein